MSSPCTSTSRTAAAAGATFGAVALGYSAHAGTEILERQPAPALPPKPTVVPSAPPAVTGATLLEDSQRRRQSALQAENARLPIGDPARQTSAQMQGLTFERETRAQDLGSAIMRSSERAVGR